MGDHELKLSQISENISSDLSNQKNKFEVLKNRKLDRQNTQNKSIMTYLYFIS